MKKFVYTLFLALAGCSTLCFLADFGVVHASIDVTGIISSDTAWVKANSPYNLIGNILVSEGVSLRIGPGVTVNLNGYHIQVNGTLRAIGTNEDKIQFNGKYLDFGSSCTDWNEQTGLGCILEHAVFDQTNVITTPEFSVVGAVKIVNSTFNFHEESGKISIYEGLVLNNTINNALVIVRSSANVSGNVVVGGIYTYGSSTLSGNNVSGAIHVIGGTPKILYNNITFRGNRWKYTGIDTADEDDAYICGNVITGFLIGIRATNTSLIENNLLTGNYHGIAMGYAAKPVIRNNTITDNCNGIYCPTKGSTIIYNNIQNNSDYNINLGPGAKSDVNATYNWWGTTDPQTISSLIHDSKHDFDLGTVTYAPFLTEPNTETNPPIIPEFPSWLILPLLLSSALLVTVYKKSLHKTPN